MSKVCRVLNSVDLNQKKYNELDKQAKMLGKLRKEIWQRFGSLAGVGANHRKTRDKWVKARDFTPLPAKAWKETLRDVLDDIQMYEASAKEKVRKAIYARVKDPAEKKRLFKTLDSNQWINDPYLSRKMRQYKKHGRTSVINQIVLEYGVYGQFKGKDGNTWLKIPSFTRGKQVCVPLNSKINLKGCLRVILKNGIVEIHHAIEQKQFNPCGGKIIGVDKGYSEAFADSEGKFHGKLLGKILTDSTENRNQKSKARNKLYQIAKKKPKKAKNIYFQAAHSIVDEAKEVRAEDLTTPMVTKTKWKKYNRLMSSWAKGSLAEALESVTQARGSCLRLVNCAYTSQMDSNTGRLEGRRVGDKFYHVNGEVSQADTNAAVNTKHRGDDTEITLYTSYKEVKRILLSRLTATGGVSELDNQFMTAPP
jgi:transposase